MAAHSPEGKEKANELSRIIIGAAIEVHQHLGPGLLESAYQACLMRELTLRGVDCEKEVPVRVAYKGVLLECAYRIDLLVGGLVVVELKAVDRLERIHEAQLLTYLRLTDRWLGLLMNFSQPVLRDGIRRLVQD